MAFLHGEHAGPALILALALLCIATQAALASIITALAWTNLHGTTILSTAIAAFVLDFIVLALSPATILICVRSSVDRSKKGVGLLLNALSFALFLAASALSIYVLGYTWVEILPHTSGSGPGFSLTIAGFVIWAVNMLLQAASHIVQALRKPELPEEPISTEPVAERQRSPRSLSIRLKSLSPGSSPFSKPSADLASPGFASPGLASYIDSPSSARSSIRHSIHQVIRPITSRTKLLLNHSPQPREPMSSTTTSRRHDSLDFGCRGDGFETWDTSAVEQTFTNPFAASSKQNATPSLQPSVLAPIPGSRPVSPARALDGPFLDTDLSSPEDLPLPSSPSSVVYRPISPTSTAHPDFYNLPFPNASFTDAESHIHPLFRSHSPTPAPNASPGTVVELGSPDFPRHMHSSASSRKGSLGSRKGSVGSRRPSGLGTQVVVFTGEEAPQVPELPRIG